MLPLTNGAVLEGLVIALEVRGDPIPQGSTKAFMRGGHVRTTSDNVNLKGWRQQVATAAQAAMRGDMALGPLRCDVEFRMKPPQAAINAKGQLKEGRHPVTKPDLDKLARAIMDGLTGIAWKDDAQVVDLHVRKVYGLQPGASVVVMTLHGYQRLTSPIPPDQQTLTDMGHVEHDPRRVPKVVNNRVKYVIECRECGAYIGEATT